ncbi:MAG: hypothetical protein ACJAWV_001531 [Flammeovirgaceae bacterium]|jgi:hypothetical protein
MKKFEKFAGKKMSKTEMNEVKGGLWVVHYANGAMSRHATQEIANTWCRSYGSGCFVHEHATISAS